MSDVLTLKRLFAAAAKLKRGDSVGMDTRMELVHAGTALALRIEDATDVIVESDGYEAAAERLMDSIFGKGWQEEFDAGTIAEVAVVLD